MPEIQPTALSRRGFLTTAARSAAAIAFAGPLLSACSGGSSTGSSQPGTGGAALPSYLPFTGTAPDLPGDPAKGINAGYLSYPTDRVRTVDGPVGTGGALTAFVASFSPPPPPLAGNAYWQAINKALNVDFKPTLVPQEFQTKLAAMLSSGDIPDLVTMYLADAQSVRRFDSVAKSRFASLSEHLSGDAVKKYPNLARFAPEAWPATYIDGEIYSTPTLRIPTAGVVFQRPQSFEDFGANPNPTGAAEFEETCKALTNPDQKRWALGASDAGWLQGLFLPMFGVPLGWRRNDDGTLTKDYETPEWETAIAYIAKLWKAGYFHPNSATMSGSDLDPLFQNGTVAMMSDSVVRYAVRADAEFSPSIMAPFAAEGTKVISYEGPVTDFVTFVKKGSKERVEESLRVLNYLSAPFGSEENFLITYGVEGRDYTLKNGEPSLSEKGTSEVKSLCLRFIGGGPDVLYASNGNSEMVKREHAYQTTAAPSRVTNPTSGLYSDAAATSGGITQQVDDTVNDVIVGRKPVSALKDAVAQWKRSGGDKVRADYEKALSERKGPTK